MIDCLISFGSNLGDSKQIIRAALSSLESRHHVSQLAISEFIATRPVGGPPNQLDFTNGAARFRTDLNPLELLQVLHDTEQEFGRERRIRWDSRKLDLDLLLYGNEILLTENCQIPHPRMSFRQFVLQPAQSIAGDMWHPICQCSLKELFFRVTNAQNIFIFGDNRDFSDLKKTLKTSFPTSSFRFLGLTELPETIDGLTDEPIRLLVARIEDGSRENFLTKHQADLAKHRGPVLILEGESDQQTFVEISAAVEAMDSI